MTLLETGFAERESGPDFVHNAMTDLLFEEWSYAWSPGVEGRLIELAARGDRLHTACRHALKAKREQLRADGRGREIAALAALLAQGLLAGLGKELADFVHGLRADLQEHADFSAVAETLRRLYNIAGSQGPLKVPEALDVTGVVESAYARLIYLCDDLPMTAAEHIGERVDSLRLMNELLDEDMAAHLERELFDAALDRIAASMPPPEILGAVLAIGVHSGRRSALQLCSALTGQFSGAVVSDSERVALLHGVLRCAPRVLLEAPDVVDAVNNSLTALDEDSFLALLPHLRLAFATLNPREIDELAERLAVRHGGTAAEFAVVRYELDERTLARGLAVEQSLRDALASDGLVSWLVDEGEA